jgi:FkbM family methyltransferase
MNKLLERIGHLTEPDSLRAALTWHPYSVSAHKLMKQLRLHDVHPKAVVDVGANKGQFARAVIETFPDCEIYSFEPLDSAFQAYQRNIEASQRVTVRQTAVGSQNGSTEFYEDQYSLASSVLEPLPEQSVRFPNTGITTRTTVPICTLDSHFASEMLRKPILLKLDVQGYEIEALRGGEKFVRQCEWVLAEASFAPMYKGESTFPVVNDWLAEHDFELVAPLAFLRDAQDRVIQSDLLYRRAQ